MSDRVWHYSDSVGVFSAPRVHANGHSRPDAVTFGTREAAASAWCRDIARRIDTCTRMIKTARTDAARVAGALERNTLRLVERRAKSLFAEAPHV